MDAAQIKQALDDVFDQAVVFHGFTAYMRDYEVLMWATADPRTGIAPEHLRLLFQHCVLARTESSIRMDVWPRSLDQRLIDYDQGVNLQGYVWGVCWQELYPGASLVPDSVDAARWSESLGIPMHEVQFKANAHNFNLVFSDLTVEVIDSGYTPFTVPPFGPEWKVPLP